MFFFAFCFRSGQSTCGQDEVSSLALKEARAFALWLIFKRGTRFIGRQTSLFLLLARVGRKTRGTMVSSDSNCSACARISLPVLVAAARAYELVLL